MRYRWGRALDASGVLLVSGLPCVWLRGGRRRDCGYWTLTCQGTRWHAITCSHTAECLHGTCMAELTLCWALSLRIALCAECSTLQLQMSLLILVWGEISMKYCRYWQTMKCPSCTVDKSWRMGSCRSSAHLSSLTSERQSSSCCLSLC